MHPPSWVCESLGKQAPLLRLGWAGRPHKSGGVNEGNFALISLFPASTYWDEDLRNKFFREFWSMTPVQLKVGDGPIKQTTFVHFERGPIFDRRGSGSLDYDPISRIPVYMQALTFDQVMLGRVAWQIPLARKIAAKEARARRQEEHQEKEKLASDARKIISDAAEDVASEMWYNANKTGAAGTANITPDYSHINAVKSGDADSILTAEDMSLA